MAHNRAIAQYLLSNLTLTDEFRKSLHTVNMQVREGTHAHSSMEFGQPYSKELASMVRGKCWELGNMYLRKIHFT